MDIAEFERRLATEAPDGVLYTGKDGIIRFWNGGCQHIFGFAAHEAIGQSLDIIIPEPLRARHWSGFEKTMRTGESRYGAGELLSVPALRKDGRRISVEFSIIPFKDGTGAMTGMGAIMRDVTKRFEEMKALRAAAAAANKASATGTT
jgi:PAS domain S-box-containing protein